MAALDVILATVFSPKSALRSIRRLLLRIIGRYPGLVAFRPAFLVNNRSLRAFKIGRFTYGVPRVLFPNPQATLTIGSFCSIAEGVTVFLGGNHRTDWVTTFPLSEFFTCCAKIPGHPASKGDVVIGHDVWIGANATILSGVHIGDGAVIAACAVVTKNVAPYTVVAGNPARVVSTRFSEQQVRDLLSIRWWDWPLSDILCNRTLLMSVNIDDFIRKHSPVE